MHTGQQGEQERNTAIKSLGRRIQPRSKVLTIMIGDWNFVHCIRDRFCKETAQWTGGRDKHNASLWESELQSPHHLFELHQDHSTCETATSRSRLDRIYSNHYICEQLDKQFSCSPLPWTCLSNHRPVSFARLASRRDPDAPRPLPSGPICHPDWPRRVALEFHTLVRSDPRGANDFRKLLLAKRAISSVTKSMHRQHLIAQADGVDDQLGWTMAMIRAAESVRLSRMETCVRAYPKLASFLNPSDPGARVHPNMDGLRQHAVELAKENIGSQISALQHLDGTDANSPRRRQAKENILKQLQRTVPGRTNGLDAMQTTSGSVTNDPAQVATALQEHWTKVFNGPRIDKEALKQWLMTVPNLTASDHAPLPSPPSLEQSRESSQVRANEPRRGRLRTHRAGDVWCTPPMAGEQRPALSTAPESWKVQREDIREAVKLSSNTMPGPDGIPYKAWRVLGELGVDILHGAAAALEGPSWKEQLNDGFHDEAPSGTHTFNLGTLVCLPKKAAGENEEVGTYYTAGGTRPLSIVNTDNRLIANAARLRWEGLLSGWITKNQQGFLNGRSILSNLIGLDTAAMHTALEGPNGAIIIFDFAAAFPSVSQEYLMETLRHIGLPPNALNFVGALYDNNQCTIMHRGRSFPGFAMTSGVRQGCPLSPLLYALAADALLEKISVSLPEVFVRAYADDTAVVLTDFWRQAPVLANIFETFADLSCLRLNTAKSVIIPLHPRGPQHPDADLGASDMVDADDATLRSLLTTASPYSLPTGATDALEALSSNIREHLPQWGNMVTAWQGLYLGFVIGPGKEDATWKKPASKCSERCRLWASQALGLQYSALTYNSFALSTLSYVAQLEAPPSWVLQEEQEMLRLVAAGPRHWATAQDLWHLKDGFGFARSFTCLSWLAKAAQLRVYMLDPAMADKDEVRRSIAQTRQTLAQPRMTDTRETWRSWFDQSFILRLEGNHAEYVARFGLVPNSQGGPARRSFQAGVYASWSKYDRYSPEERIRLKHRRWQLSSSGLLAGMNFSARQGTPAGQARRALHNLRCLADYVAPRVQSAVLSTIWNRWCTARRFQRRHLGSTSACVFRCSPTAEDSIEHYCRCPSTLLLASSYLRLDNHTQVNLYTFNLTNPHIRTCEELVVSALLIYAIYRGTNHYRHHAAGCPQDVHDSLRQWTREGVARHQRSTHILQNLWRPSTARTVLPPPPAQLPLRMPGRSERVHVPRPAGRSGTRRSIESQEMGRSVRARTMLGVTTPRFVDGGFLHVEEVRPNSSEIT